MSTTQHGQQPYKFRKKKFPIPLPMLNLKHTNNMDQTEYIAQPEKSLEKFLHLTL